MSNPFDQFDGADTGAANPFDQFDAPEKPKKQNKGIVGDIGTGLKRGVEQMPGMVTGLADLAVSPVSSITGVNRPFSRAADYLGDKTGFQPGKWAEQAAEEYSPEMQQSLRKVQEADGFTGTLKAIAENPRSAVNLVAESLPSTLAGGILARGAMGAVTGAEKLAALRTAAAGGDAAAKASLMKAGSIAGGIGEGAVTAGQQMAQTDYDVNPLKAAGAAAAAGIGTGIIGGVSGRIANKLGLADVEGAIASGTLGAAKKSGKAAYAGRIAGGALQEGVLEELPQSAQEQVWQNVANDKPWDEGVGKASAQGLVAGMAMGAGVNALPGSKYVESKTKPPVEDQQPIAGLLPAPNYTGTPSDQLIANDAERQAAIDAADANAAAVYAARDAFESQLRQSVTIINEPAPLQQRIDDMLSVDSSKLNPIQRANYEKTLAAAFGEQIGIRHDANQREVPFTMGEYLDAQVAAENAVRARPLKQNANQQADSRLQQVADEEGYIAPEIPVVGTLSAVANMAIQSGAHKQSQMQQAMQAAVANQKTTNEGVSRASATEQVAQEVTQTNDAQAGLASSAAQAASQGTGSVQVSIPQQANSDTLAPSVEANYNQLSANSTNALAQTPANTATTEKRGIKPLNKWTAEELQNRLDRGAATGDLSPDSRQSIEARLSVVKAADAENAAKEAAKAERVAKMRAANEANKGTFLIGTDKDNTERVSVRNGTVYLGDYAAEDFETGDDITVPEGATKQQIFDTLINGKAVTGKIKIFGKNGPEQSAADRMAELEAERSAMSPVEREAAVAVEAAIDAVVSAADRNGIEQSTEPVLSYIGASNEEIQQSNQASDDDAWAERQAEERQAGAFAGSGREAVGSNQERNGNAQGQAGAVANQNTIKSEAHAAASVSAESVVTKQEPIKNYAPKQKAVRNKIDPEKDSLFVAIAKAGGMDTDELLRNGIDSADITRETAGRVNKKTGALSKKRRMPISYGFAMPLHKKGGMSFDSMREAMQQYGYLPDGATKNEAIDLFRRELSGDAVYTPQSIELRREQDQEQFDNMMREEQDRINVELAAREIAEEDSGYNELSDEAQSLADDFAELAFGESGKQDENAIRAGMRALGFTEEEINDELAKNSQAQRESEEITEGASQEGGAGRNGNRTEDAQARQRDGQEGFDLAGQTNSQAADQFASQQETEREPTKDQADRERDAVPFSLGMQSQPKPQGVQTGLFTADGRAAKDATVDAEKQDETKQSPRERGAADFAAGRERIIPDDLRNDMAIEYNRGYAEAKNESDYLKMREGKEVVVLPSEFPLADVDSSYSHISHSGTSRARGDRDAFVETVNRLYDEAMEKAETDEQKSAAKRSAVEFKDEYLRRLQPVIRVRGQTYSGFVAGRGNLNSKQADSRNSALDRALDSFSAWQRGAESEIMQSVRDARNDDQLAAEQQAKDDKAAKRRESEKKHVAALLNYTKGDGSKFGNYPIARVTMDRDGYPSSVTVDANDLTDNKFDIAKTLFNGDKDKLRSIVDEIRAEKTANVSVENDGTVRQYNTMADVDSAITGIYDGTISLEDYKAAFNGLMSNKETITGELGKMTIPQLLERFGKQPYGRPEKKGEIVERAFEAVRNVFALRRSYGRNSYTMGRGEYEKYLADNLKALTELVNSSTTDDLKKFADEIGNTRAARQEKIAAAQDPKTVEDFNNALRLKMAADNIKFAEARMSLTPEQRAEYDRLKGIESRDQRKARADQQKTDVRVASQTTDGMVVETKHTKTGEPLFVVKAAERVDRDIYNLWNTTAKRMGGYYSSFRGNGAVPGFQFKTRENADAFLAFIGGNAEAAKEVVQERRDAFADDRSQSAIERLNEMAERLEEKADESLGRERKANTERRARFAASAEAAANAEKAMAKTMRRIAEAISNGSTKFLDRVRQKAQIEYLASVLRTAKYAEARAKFPQDWDRNQRHNEPATGETADYAEFPQYAMMRSDLANLARKMVTLPNMKMLGQRILKAADDTSTIYNAFAKEHLLEVSRFGKSDGSGWATFSTLKDAERSIEVSGLTAVAVPLQIKRGEYRLVLSPSEAINRGIWKGDDRKMFISPEIGEEIVEKLGRLNRKHGKRRGMDAPPEAPWQFENAYNNRKRLAGLGIEQPWEFRAALREFAELKESPKEADKIKAMERAMIGRKNDGLDFFPTPAETAQAMIDAAEITEGMSVLEPSAGMGHIAEQIRDVAGIDPDVIEFNGERRELLEAKGFNVVGSDFMDLSPRGFTFGDVFRAPDGTVGVMRGGGGLGSNRVGLQPLDESGKPDARRSQWVDRDSLEEVEKRGLESGYDRIIMNPPFSNRRDAEHVQHAYSLLRPGGRVVAIMGEGVFFGQDKKAQTFRDWLDQVGGTSEKLEEGTFLDPSLPVNTATNARMVVIDKPAGDTAPVDNEGAGSITSNDKLTPADQAIYGMAAEGKSAAEILKFIASASRSPMNRQLAKLLQKTGIAPVVTVGDSKGWKMNAGEGHKYAAAYNPKTDTVALFRPASAERHMLHELIHAATIRALGKKGLASIQMKALFAHVQKNGKSVGLFYDKATKRGVYGMADVDEFIAEAFSNPKFQEMLKQVSAPSTSNLKNGWNWFVRIVRNILGLPQGQENALSQAIEIGLGVMREDMKLRNSEVGVPFSEITGQEIEQTIGRTIQEKASNWMRAKLQGKTFRNDATGWDISVGRKGINKTISHGAKETHARSVAAIPSLLKNAILVESEENRNEKERDDVPMVHHFYAPLRTGGGEYIAHMVVKETRNGQRFYDYETSDEISPAVPEATHTFSQVRGVAPSARLTMSMTKLLSHVKKEHGWTDPKFTRYANAGNVRNMPDNSTASGRGNNAPAPEADIGEAKYGAMEYTPAQKDKISANRVRQINARGLRHAQTGDFESYYTPVLQAAYDLGQNGIDISEEPIVEGVRYGSAPPSGLSKNYLDDIVETGLSLAMVKGGRETPSSIWFKDRKVYEYRGILVGKGSDGEALILPLHVENFDDINPMDALRNEPTASAGSDAIRYAKDDTRTKQTDTEAFRKWFGSSAVVDANGEPLVVYHGSDVDFNIFERGKNKAFDPRGFYFSPFKEGAESYSARGTGFVKQVYLSIKNPYIAKSYMDVSKMSKERIADLEAKGYDGAYYKPDIGKPFSYYYQEEWVAFRAEQIKSATDNAGSFDATNPDIRYNVADDGWSVSEPSKMDDLIYSLQDKQIDMKRVMQSIMRTGKKVKDEVNAYLQEELFHGRAAKGVKDFLDFELRPLLSDMQKAGVDMGDFEEYLWNRHAPERNAQIAKINPEMPDAGSGIKTADARAYMAALSPEQKAKYESLAERIETINANSQGILVSSGLEKQSTIDAWNGAYKHYVPLQREDVDSGHVGTGKGFSVRGSSSKRAMGSGKKVVDIIANLTMQRERNIVRAEKNRVSNAVMGLAKENPNADFWTVDQAPKERVVEETAVYTVRDESGKKLEEFTRMDDADRFAKKNPGSEIEQTWEDRVKERVTPGFTSRDNVLLTRINGEDHYVIFNERDDRAMRMAMALKNLDVDNMGRVLSVVGKATRYLASVNTQYNPVFGVINLIRDAQGALLNLTSTPLAGEQKRVLGYTVDALRGIYSDIRAHRKGDKPSSKWASLFEEFQKEGGQTGYRDQFANAEARAEAIKSELEQFKEGKAKQFTRGVFGWLSDYNETMENAVRLAAYKAAKEKGMSNQQAASLAKNITVNFNRKGQMATQVGALYAFFNASVQGTARIAETLFEQHGGDLKNVRLSKVGKKIVMGGIMLGSMQALLLAAAGYDDDEPPEFIRERNLILPIGDGKYLTLAMPLGFHVLPGIGRIATEFLMSGGKDPAKRAISFVSMFAEAFNPVGSSGFSLQTITPSVVDPFAALAENKDFTGKEIYREDFNKLNPTPGNMRAKDVATVWSRYISAALNFITGGTEFKPGAFSPSPDSIDYLIAQAGGGVMREANKVAQTIGAATTGEELPLYKIPLAGRFIGDTEGQSGQSAKFYDAIKQINMHEAEYKGLLKSGRRQEASEYLAENPAVKLIMAGNHAESQVRKLRSMKRDLVEKDADKDQVRAIDDRITSTMRKLNERASQFI